MAFARYASQNPPLAKLSCSSEKVAWKGSSHLISVIENSSSKRVTMSTLGTITLPSFNILLSGTDAAIEDLAILGLFFLLPLSYIYPWPAHSVAEAPCLTSL